jgi:hypothetical protein
LLGIYLSHAKKIGKRFYPLPESLRLLQGT